MEFELIQKFFMRRSQHSHILLENGDDCALLTSNQVLAFSIDTLVVGTHFLPSMAPADLGYRALAVNLSDLAAMGAKPMAFLLSLTLPDINESWLAAFSQGLLHLADSFKMDLIGGNTTRGPLAITIQIIGELPPDKALKRSGAKIEDDLYVTGKLGLRPIRPVPRIEFAQRLLDLAHAAIDLSDGLTQDLSHILKASRCGALIDPDLIPGTDYNYGEDYELCFTASAENRDKIKELAELTQTPVCIIGKIIQEPGIYNSRTREAIAIKGYQHFT